MSSFAAASTIPVTNKVAHANSRKSLRIRVITSPMRTAPCSADVPGAGRRRDGDTSNLAQNARRFDWFPRPTLFWCLKFSFCSHGGAMKVVGIVPLGGAGEVVEVDETKIGKVDGATRCAHSGLMPCSKPHSYSITLSARASNSGEMLRPSALAALRLMTRSNLVGCCIGSSPGLAPWRILST